MLIKIVELQVALFDYEEGLGLRLARGEVVKRLIPITRGRMRKVEELLEELEKRRAAGMREF